MQSEWVRKAVGKSPLGRPRGRRESIQTVLKATGWQGVEFINLAEDTNMGRAAVNTVTYIRVLQKKNRKFLRYQWNCRFLKQDFAPAPW